MDPSETTSSLWKQLPVHLTDPYLLGDSIWTSRPYRFTQSPLKLFFEDAMTFGNVLWTILNVVTPLNGPDDGDVKLCSSRRGRASDIIVSGVSIVQALMLPAAITGIIVLPGLLAFFLLLSMMLFTWVVLLPIQGPRLVESQVNFSDAEGHERGSESREKWIFLNGVMVHHIGTQSAVDAIARVFRRPVLGIHNETSGFLGDVLECLMQRCFAYSTVDVRFAFQEIFNHVTDPKIDKIVLIAHSQGGIIASLVVDRLLDELPASTVGKLEIYTFGSAASHFNNPSHRCERSGAVGAVMESASNGSRYNTSGISNNPAEYSVHPLSNQPHQNETLASNSAMQACPNHVILNIEHYANEHDPIPRWGVLHAFKDLYDTRYNGKLFVRRGASGHFFTSHYLASWFPLDAVQADQLKNQNVTLQALTSRETEPPRINHTVDTFNDDSMLQRATSMEWGNDQPATKHDLEQMEASRRRFGEGEFYVLGKEPLYTQRMHKISRLWQYVGGKCPR